MQIVADRFSDKAPSHAFLFDCGTVSAVHFLSFSVHQVFLVFLVGYVEERPR